MRTLLISIPFIFLLSCNHNSKLTTLTDLSLEEVSGLEFIPETGALWAIEDSGNKNRLYRINDKGKPEQEITIENIENKDWEDLAADKQGNLYIGDFGNNDSDRKNLTIYKIDAASLNGKKASASSIIEFYYPEQKDFPPKKSKRFYDVEAFFEHDGNFFLFTKNRSSGFNGELYVYKVANRAGRQAAQRLGTLSTCGMYSKCAVTAADISPDGKTAILLSGDKVWTTAFNPENIGKAKLQMHELGHFTQKEGLCFKDAETILIADEKDKRGGGNLYELKMADLK